MITYIIRRLIQTAIVLILVSFIVFSILYLIPGDPVVTMAGGGKRFTQMLLPDDYMKAIQNAVTAPDFEAKQKWIHEVQRLMINKYCLMIPIASQNGNTVNKTYVHNHGFHATPNTVWWTPEEA